MKNWVNWFEIPAVDFERATAFYGTLFGIELQVIEMSGTKMGMFPSETGGGAVVKGDDFVPSTSGTLVYLNGGDDLSEPLSKVETAGGKVIVPKTNIGPGMGNFAIFIDTEGNKVALHSMN